MQERVRVRRDRPSALTWAIALAVTMLAVYLITLSTPEEKKVADASADVRITQELNFEPLTIHFADLGSHDDPLQARISAASYADRGAAGVVYADKDGYHVLGAGYALEADAKRIAGRLGEQEDVAARVLTLTAPALSLRVTAPESDVNAIADADRMLRTQLNELNTLALQVDRGEISSLSARTLTKVAAAEVRTVRKRLESIAGSADQPVCAGLIFQLDSLEKNLSCVSGEGAVLSGKLRCCHAEAAIRLIEFLCNPTEQKISPNA